MTLLPEERRQLILQQLQRHGKIQVASLANVLTVTPETIRRDLDELEAKQMLKRVYKAFISCAGITLAGISDYDMEESICSTLMMQQSKHVYVLGGHTKLGVKQLCRICDLNQATAVICDQPMPNNWRCDSVKIEWIAAPMLTPSITSR